MKNENEEKMGLSRREFLKGAAVTSAAGVIGAVGPRDVTASAQAAEQEELLRQQEVWKRSDWRLRVKNLKIEKLLEPGMIGKVKTRNRMVKTAAYGWILWDMKNQKFLPAGLSYYESIAKGGVGLMIMEDPAFRPDTIGRPLQNDEQIEVEKELVNRVKKHGCPIFAQITDFRPLMGIAASSAVNYPSKLDMNNGMPVALSIDEIHDNTKLIADCAERCQKAGYDGIELNTGCSHMFATFTSRFWNRREDEYGAQNFVNRARIVTDIIKAVKERCGSDFAMGVLMNGYEIDTVELGNNRLTMTVEEAVELAKLYEEAGADEIQVRSHSIGNHITGFFPDCYWMFGEQADTGFGQPIDIKKFWPQFVTEYDGSCGFIDTAAIIKKALTIPVMTVGSMDPRANPDVVENALAEGKIDYVAMTRPLTADPELPNKIAEGRIDDITPCTQCITCFPMTRCRVNASSTRGETPEMPDGPEIKPAATKKTVVVVGGGPGGMEAARVAAVRGHNVTLFEKTSRLGGLMPVAAVVKGRHERLVDYSNYLSGQLEKLGVDVRTGTEATVEKITALNPDAVIVAVGGATPRPDIKGIDNKIVMSSDSLHKTLETGLKIFSPYTLRTLGKVYMPVGDKVIIIGGHIQGVQLAEFLSQYDKDITIVDEEPLEKLGLNMPNYVKERVVLYNQSHGVKTMMGVKIGEITDEGMTVTTDYGITKTIPADSIIVALDTVPNSSLVDDLQGLVPAVFAVGDCAKPGVIVDAVEAGNLTARNI